MKPLVVFALGAVFGAAACGLLAPRWAALDLLGQARQLLAPPVAPALRDSGRVAPGVEIPMADADPIPAPQTPEELPSLPMPALEVIQASPAVPPSTPYVTEMPALVRPPSTLLTMPVMGVTVADLHDQFADARGEGRGHEAIDIAAPLGTPVLAVAAGRVEKLFDSKRGGLTVYQFDVEDKLAYYYAHLDHYAAGLSEGQQLARGEVIGYVGSSGNADALAPHLHFAVFLLGPEKHWWQGTPINPYPLLGGK
ncbi:MAG: M23 family metallopeptidase [Lysobacterales bacterium]